MAAAMSARILLVEDDPALLSILKAAVSFGGFSEESVDTGRAAIAAFERGGFDAVLIDLGLPDIEGTEVLLRLRRISNVPIMVVSGRDAEQDKIELLDLGADDYIAKPFLPGELLARLRAAIRRHRAQGDGARQSSLGDSRDPVRLGRLTLDPFHRSIEVNGETALLTEGEFTILRALVAADGAFVPKEALLAALYPEGDAPEETRIVEVYISNIRRKLRMLDEQEMILNARTRGWKLDLPTS